MSSQGTEFTIGSEVACTDGVAGKLGRVVIDPVARALTHLVVEPAHGHGFGRLVPIELVDSAANEISLRATLAEFAALDEAEETEFLPAPDLSGWGYGPGEVMAQPYFGLGFARGLDMGLPPGPHTIMHDRVPVWEVEVRRGEPVHATDGTIGRVRGLVIDPQDHHVTHFLLEEGHLWGKKVVAIPIGAVKDVTDGVKLTLTKEAVGELPPVELAQDA
jgi:sporulation protein YlmC with PRC-barrel domain